MIWNGELHQSVVCSGFLLVNLVCNTFLVSVCVRSSVLQSGVHRFVLLSPRVILVGTVYGQLPVCVKSLYRLCENLRVFQTWQPQLGLQDIIRDSPHKWFRSHTEVHQARETSGAEEYQRTHEKADE